MTGKSGHRRVPESFYSSMEIPVPEDKKIQVKIAEECAKIDKEFHDCSSFIETTLDDISSMMSSVDQYENVRLGSVADYVSDRVNNPNMDNYVTTDNMVQNKIGITPYKGNKVPSAIAYQKGDILVSNIRPYLRKIWFANVDGTCSPDVLVFRMKEQQDVQVNNRYLYYSLWQDDFFDFMMQDVTGKKMPRGDKNKLLDFEIKIPKDYQRQEAIAEKIDKLMDKIDKARNSIATSSARKQAIMDKYLK